MTQIERITRMEQILNEAGTAVNALRAALRQYETLLPAIRELEAYYTGQQWMQDFDDDRAGRLPASLPRGVLTEDAVYDLLTDVAAIRSLCGAIASPKP